MASTPALPMPDEERPVLVWSEELHPEHHHPAVVQALQHAEALAQMAHLLREGDQAFAAGGDLQSPQIPADLVPILKTIDRWSPRQWVPQDAYKTPVTSPSHAPWVSAVPVRDQPLPEWDPQMRRVYHQVRDQQKAFTHHGAAQRVWQGVTHLVITAARLDAQDRQFQLGRRDEPVVAPDPLMTDAWTETIRNAQVDCYLHMTDPTSLAPSVETPPATPENPSESLDLDAEEAGPDAALWQIGKLDAQRSIAWQTADDGTVTWWQGADGAPATLGRTDQAVAAIRATGAPCQVAMNAQHEAWVPEPILEAWIQAQITYAVSKDQQLHAEKPNTPLPHPISRGEGAPKPSPVIPTMLQAINRQYAVAYQLIPAADHGQPSLVFVPNPDSQAARNGIAPPQKFERAIADDPGVRRLWATQHHVTWADYPVQALDVMPKPVREALTTVVQQFRASAPEAPIPETATASAGAPWNAYAHDADHWTVFRMDAQHRVQWAKPGTATPSDTLHWMTEQEVKVWQAEQPQQPPLAPVQRLDALPASVAAPIAVALRNLAPTTPPIAAPAPTLSLTPPAW